MPDPTMVPMDPVKVQAMQQGYEARIERQKGVINRLQIAMARQAESYAAELASLREDGLRLQAQGQHLQQQVFQLAAEAKNLRALIDATHANAPAPTDPHSAPAEWHRVVPEAPTGPASSPSEIELPFDAWETLTGVPGETAPSKSI